MARLLTGTPRRNPFFLNESREPSTVKDPDDTESYVFDWTDDLDASETVSSMTVESGGPTNDGGTLATPKVTVVVSGSSSGRIVVKATTSASRILSKTLYIYAQEPSSDGAW